MASAIPPLPTGGALKNPKGGKLAQLKQAMTQAQPDTQKNASSVKAMEAYLAATQGMSAKQKKAYVLKRRADEARIQQLRGIFAAYDEDKDGVLSEEELSNALLALGFEPTAEVLEKFAMSSPAAKVDLASFVRITMTGLHEPETTEPFIEALFRECDPGNSGRVPLSTLLHLLAEVDTPSSLSVEEVNDLLKMTGILAELQSRDAKAIYSTQVDYRALARHMVFPLSKPLGGIGSIGKAAGAGAAAGAAAAGAGSS